MSRGVANCETNTGQHYADRRCTFGNGALGYWDGDATRDVICIALFLFLLLVLYFHTND